MIDNGDLPRPQEQNVNTTNSMEVSTGLPPRRKISRLVRVPSEFTIKRPSIEGLQHLSEVPPNKPLVVATTHLSDVDVTAVAAAINEYRNVGIASQTSNQTDPVMKIGIKAIGKEHFFGVKNYKQKGPYRYVFDPNDYDIMKKAMAEEGRAMVIAAHKPVYDLKLPGNPGLGAVYLAQLTDAMILPVALDIQSNRPTGNSDDALGAFKRFFLRQRPRSRIIIGKPFELDKIPQEQLKTVKYALKHDLRHSAPNDASIEGRRVVDQLKKQGNLVMKALASLLPEQKRGPWEMHTL